MSDDRTAVVAPPFLATARQLDLARAWHDASARIVVADGAYRSGKTQGAGRLLVEEALTRPGLYLVARQGYRALADSTQRAIVHGDGSLPPLLPREAVVEFRKAENTIRLHNGAELLFRSLEEGASEKLRGLTLAGAFVDQAEELDEGDAGERLFDTILGRLSDPRGSRKVLVASNPGPLTHWLYRRLVNPQTRDPGVAVVRFSMRDNEANLPADYLADQEATAETRPYYFRSFVLGEWGHFAGAAFEEFTERVHVAEPFELPAAWERFESMDHGTSNPTCWLLWGADHDGNLVVADEYYAPGLVSEHAAEILRRRSPDGGAPLPTGRNWWQRRGERGFEDHPGFADPSIKANHGLTTRWGEPASVWREYLEHGITLRPGNNDRRAGYARLLELLHVDPDRVAPFWARVPADVVGSPRLFVFATCTNLIEQLKSAPLSEDARDHGEAISGKWESQHGHATASARYGAMTWADAPALPDEKDREPQDPRAAYLWRLDRSTHDDWARARDARFPYIYVG